ncbi:MAG: hypothetical protein WD077_07440 [Bacteroidia bacterium]
MEHPDILEKYFAAVRDAPKVMEVDKAAEIIFRDQLVQTKGPVSLQQLAIWAVGSLSVLLIVGLGVWAYYEYHATEVASPDVRETLAVLDSAENNQEPVFVINPIQGDSPDGNMDSENELQDRGATSFPRDNSMNTGNPYYIPNQWYNFRSSVGSQYKESIGVKLLINNRKELLFSRHFDLDPKQGDRAAVYFFGKKENISINVLSDGKVQTTFNRGEFRFIPFIESEYVDVNIGDTLILLCDNDQESRCMIKEETPNRLMFHSSVASGAILVKGLNKKSIHLSRKQKLAFGAGGIIVQIPN